MEVGKLFITLGLSVNGFLKDLSGVSRSLGSLGKGVASMGQSLTASLTVPLVGLGTKALKVAGDFDSGMRRVGAVTQASGKDMQRLTAFAKEMGEKTTFSASEAAQGMEELAKAGFGTNEIMEALPGVLAAAAAEGLGLGEAAETVGGIMNGFGLEADKARDIADKLTQTAINSNAGIRDLGQAFQYVGPVAHSVGMTFDETAALLGVLADNALKGEMGGTALRGAIEALINPTDEAKAKLDALGISVFDSSGQMRPMKDIIEQLGLSSITSADYFEIFGQRAGPGMQALVNAGVGAVQDLEGKIANAGGTAERVGNAQMGGFKGAVEQLKGAFEGLAIAIGNAGLLEFATKAARRLTGYVNAASNASHSTQEMALKWAAYSAAAGPALLITGKLAQALGAGGTLQKALGTLRKAFDFGASGIRLLLSPIGLLMSAIGAMVVFLIGAADDIEWAFGQLADFISQILGRIAQWISQKLSEIIQLIIYTFYEVLPDRMREGLVKMGVGIEQWGRDALVSLKDFAKETKEWAGEYGEYGLLAINIFADRFEKGLTKIGAVAGPKLQGIYNRFKTFWADLNRDAGSGMGDVAAEVDSGFFDVYAKFQGWFRSAQTLFGVEFRALVGTAKGEFGELSPAITHEMTVAQHSVLDQMGLFKGAMVEATRQMIGDVAEEMKKLEAKAKEAFAGAMAEAHGEVKKQAPAVYQTFASFVDDVIAKFGTLKDKVSELSDTIAHDILTGDLSISNVFKQLAIDLGASVLSTIINSILTQLIAKIKEIYSAMRGDGFSPKPGGFQKPGVPGGDGGDGNPGGGVGLPIRSKSLAPMLDEFTNASANQGVNLALSALRQGLTTMILNFGDYGSASAERILNELFGPEGTLRNVPGFNQEDFPDLFDLVKWFFDNIGNWFPGNGWGPGDGRGGIGGGWKIGPGGWGGLDLNLGGAAAAALPSFAGLGGSGAAGPIAGIGNSSKPVLVLVTEREAQEWVRARAQGLAGRLDGPGFY